MCMYCRCSELTTKVGLNGVLRLAEEFNSILNLQYISADKNSSYKRFSLHKPPKNKFPFFHTCLRQD